MDRHTERQLRDAVRWGDYSAVRDLAHTLWRKDDYGQLREIIREEAPVTEYQEIGQATFYDGIEVHEKFGVYNTK